MLRYFKPKSDNSTTGDAADAIITSEISTTDNVRNADTASPINMSYNSTNCPPTSSSSNANGNIVARASEAAHITHSALPDDVDVAEYYKQIRMASLQQQQQQQQQQQDQLIAAAAAAAHHHEHRDKAVMGHHSIQAELDDYRLRAGNEAIKRYHDMKSSASSSDVHADEPDVKRIKHGGSPSPSTSSSQQQQSLDQQYTDITWRLPSQTLPPPATKSKTTSSRDTSKLPTEEISGPSRSSAIIHPKVETTSLPNMTPEMKAMLMWQKIRAENLDCDYVKVFNKRVADELFQECEKTLTYYTGELAQIKIYGKKVDIPRKQVAHGDEGVSYTYSGGTLPAKPWTPVLTMIKERIQEVVQHEFNFVLINRYEDGNHYMGEHRDDEKELRRAAPIASVSLGCTRDFIFRHTDCRGREAKRQIPPIKLQLEHGSLLVMKYPTNEYWYHQLPVRKKAKTPRINLTFRDIVVKEATK